MTERKAKSNSVITTAVTPSGMIEFTILKGNEDGTNAVLRLDPTAVSDANRIRAMRHGFIQKVSDRAALDRNKTTGQAATPAEKLTAMKSLVDHLASGSEDWSPARAEGKARVDQLDPVVIAAVCEVTGKDEATIRALIASGAEKAKVSKAVYLAVLGAGKKVKPVVERMNLERATGAGLDGDEMLEEAMGDD